MVAVRVMIDLGAYIEDVCSRGEGGLKNAEATINFACKRPNFVGRKLVKFWERPL